MLRCLLEVAAVRERFAHGSNPQNRVQQIQIPRSGRNANVSAKAQIVVSCPLASPSDRLQRRGAAVPVNEPVRGRLLPRINREAKQETDRH